MDMKFSLSSTGSCYLGQLFYLEDEFSFFYDPPCSECNASILIYAKYAQLGVALATGEIMTLFGYAPRKSWIKKDISLPKSKKGKLYVTFQEAPISGGGLLYKDNWKIYYDPKNSIICLGETVFNSDRFESVEFSEGVFAVLDGAKLVNILAKVTIR